MGKRNSFILNNRNPGFSRIKDLLDVDLTSLSDLGTLRWNDSAETWEAVAAGVYSVDEVQFNTSYIPGSEPEGLMWWNSSDKAINIASGVGPVLQVGQEILIRVYNDTGFQIDDGTAVYPTGTFNNTPTIGKAKSDTHTTIAIDYGMTTMDIPDGQYGFVTWFGKVHGIDTSLFDVGDPIYISATAEGELTKDKPGFPNYAIQIGIVFTKDALDGMIFVTGRNSVNDTFDNYWNGTFRETIKFIVSESGGVVIGTLEPENGHDDMTMIFSDGFTMLATNPPLTITLTPGTDTTPQLNYIYIPQSTKVITVSTTQWPASEHIKIAQVFLKTAITTGTDGPLMNQFWSDHIQDTVTNMGHAGHVSHRLRLSPAIWVSGIEATATIVGASTPDDVYIATTSGTVFQSHEEIVDIIDMSIGDKIHIVNHNSTPYVAISNLNSQTLDALGNSLDGRSFSIVIWGVQSVPGQAPQLMANLPIGSYSKASPTDAASDIYGYSIYNIPTEFKGTGFLIARFTFILETGSLVWSEYEKQDLRGKIPNSTAGAGSGASGVTTFLGLTDTESTYAGKSKDLIQVNTGETALESTSAPTIPDFTNATHDHSNDTNGGIYATHEADFWNGTLRESFNALVTSDGAIITLSVEQYGGGDLTMRFSDGETILDCTPAKTITLTAGSVTVPQENFVYIPQTTKVLTLSTTAWPTTEHTKIAYCYLQTATVVQADGALINQNWNDHLAGPNGQGHLAHMSLRSRRLGSSYFSGIDGTGSDDYTTSAAGSVTVQIGSGIIFQMHKHTFDAIDTSGTDNLHVVNAEVALGAFYQTQNLYDIVNDSTGSTLTNKYFNIVLWGVANKEGEYAPAMVNIPSGSYNNLSDAENDVNGYDVYAIPREFNIESSSGFLIARMTFKSTGGTWTYYSSVDLRGTTPSTVTGAAGGVVTEFADNQFKIYDVADVSANMIMDASGITTSTTRTITIPDSNETIGVDQTAIHDNVASEISAIAEKVTPVSADLIVIEDSASSNVKKKVQLGNLPGGGGTDADAIHDNVASEISAVSAKATPIGADYLLIEDSADSNNKKSITVSALDILRSQLTDLWRDNTSNVTTNPHIQSGLTTFSFAGTAGTFDNAYTGTPRMVATARTRDDSATVTALSTTGWTGSLEDIHDTGTPSVTTYWIAIGNKT